MKLFSRDKPKIKASKAKPENFNGWNKCVGCHEMIHANELNKNWHCCPKCGTHYRISAEKWIGLLADPDSFTRLFTQFSPVDPLQFVDSESYAERLRRVQEATQEKDAVIAGCCEIGGIQVAIAVMNFEFMVGSMGSVVGEVITQTIEHALENKQPLIIVATSGGARMQESIFSLMQMAKTSAALARLAEAGLPFISVLTDPTTGGVTASFASLGDLILAEPDALICFAGPRVVEQVIRQKLPKGAQRAEFLLEHGMVDAIVPRPEMKKKIALCLEFFTGPRKQFVTMHATGKQPRA